MRDRVKVFAVATLLAAGWMVVLTLAADGLR